MLALKSTRLSQAGTGGPSSIRWGEAITGGLLFLDGRPGINRLPDFGGLNYPTASGTVTNILGRAGIGVETAFGGNFLSYGAIGRISPPYTLVCSYLLHQSPGTFTRLFGNFQASSYGSTFSLGGTNNRIIVAGGGGNDVVNGLPHQLGVLRTAVAVVTATRAMFIEDGQLTAGPTAVRTAGLPTGDLRIGQDNGGTGAPRAQVFLTAIYGRALSIEEARSLSANPWQIFR